MNHIVESIGKWGVVSTPAEFRLNRVRGGDIIECVETLRTYPIAHRYSRISTISEDGIASVCEGMGSAHLLKDGSCDISGGPWWGIPIEFLEPTYSLHEATYWNWGNNSPGASQGIYYNIFRPLHRLTIHPDNVKCRYGNNEIDARLGKFNHEHTLNENEWKLLRKGRKIGGEFNYIFQRTIKDDQ